MFQCLKYIVQYPNLSAALESESICAGVNYLKADAVISTISIACLIWFLITTLILSFIEDAKGV